MSSPAVDALRHAASDAYVVLDREDRITHVSARLHDDLGHWVGHVLWDHLPGARDGYAPRLDEARSSGCPVDSVVYYSGRVMRLTAIPGADGIALHVECLAELDVTTLGTLTRSLARIEAVLAARESERSGSPARASLRALP
jgi:hypothetical protein